MMLGISAPMLSIFTEICKLVTVQYLLEQSLISHLSCNGYQKPLTGQKWYTAAQASIKWLFVIVHSLQKLFRMKKINQTYLTRAWTILEQVVGEPDITTIGSAVRTNSQSRWTCEITGEKQWNIWTSCTEDNTVGGGNGERFISDGEPGAVRAPTLLLWLGMWAWNTQYTITC
jgi:hypothetical protein